MEAEIFFEPVQRDSMFNAVRLFAQQGSMDLTTLREELISTWKRVRPRYSDLPQKSNFWDVVDIDVRQSVGMTRNCQNKRGGCLFNPLKS